MKLSKAYINIAIIVISVGIIYSLVPTIMLYVKKIPAPYLNTQAAEKLNGNKGDGFEFIVLGDTHSGLIFNDSATLKLVRQMNIEDRFRKLPVDFVLNLGDVTFRGSKRDYATYNKIRSLIKWPVISAIGNHDDDDDKSGTTYFEENVGEKEFSFIDRNCFFLVIDNSTGDLSEKQFEWLERELIASKPYAHRFVAAHKSPVSPYQQSWYRPELSPWSYRFMKLCEKYNVDIVFSGHEHLFSEKSFGGVKYIVSGGGGNLIHFPDPDGGYLHYLVVRVIGDYVDYEVRKISPPFWELLTYYLWKDAFYFIKSVLF